MYNILTDAEIAHLFHLFKDKQNEFVQHIVKTLPDRIYVMNLESHALIYSSRLIAAEVGYSSNEVELMKDPLLDIMHPDDRPRFLQHLEQVKLSEPGEVLPIDYRLIRRDGTIAWFVDRNTVFTRSVTGTPLTKIGVTHEITVRKELEERLLKLESIIEQTEVLAGTGSWEYDTHTSAFTWSKGMYSLFDLPQTTAIAPELYKQFSTEADLAIAEKIVSAIRNHEAFEELLHIRINGSVKSVKIKAAPIAGPSGNGKIVGVDLDVTKDEHQQGQVQQLNKDLLARNRDVKSLHFDLQTLTRLTASDYKQNFQNIYTLLELLIMHDAEKLGNSGKANVRRMQSVLQKLNLMTDDILSYLNLSQDGLLLKEHTLKNSLTTIVSEMQEKLTNAEAAVDLQVSGVIRADSNLFSLLIHHLLLNAIKFHQDGRPLQISLRSDLVTIEDGNFLALTVKDNGIGFDSKEKEKIFELFYKNNGQTPQRGSGVGLAIARKIMELHHGMIQAVSTPGEGAQFICYFRID